MDKWKWYYKGFYAGQTYNGGQLLRLDEPEILYDAAKECFDKEEDDD